MIFNILSQVIHVTVPVSFNVVALGNIRGTKTLVFLKNYMCLTSASIMLPWKHNQALPWAWHMLKCLKIHTHIYRMHKFVETLKVIARNLWRKPCKHGILPLCRYCCHGNSICLVISKTTWHISIKFSPNFIICQRLLMGKK